MKKSIIAFVAVFVTWFLMDWVIHGQLLAGIYESTKELWRPEEEMNMGYMMGITVIFSALFVIIYSVIVSPKSLGSGVQYGILLGLLLGVAGGLAPYCWMPIPFSLALGWFFATLAELTVGGVIVGAVIKQ